MNRWNTTETPRCVMGKCSDEVLVTVEDHETGRRKVIRAVYIPYHNCTVEDLRWDMCDGVPDDWEYYDEGDTWWIPEGWYEVCTYYPEYMYFVIEDNVVAWMSMPIPYKQ